MDVLGPFKDYQKNEVIKQLKSIGITDGYTINKDYTVDLNKEVSILIKNVYYCPVNFNIANGNFIWHLSDLRSMKNLPKIVNGNLIIASNDIKSFKDCQTTIVTGQFNCSGNKLENLIGGPLKTGDYIAINCGLKSLEGAPDEINGDFLVNNNNLTSLEWAPRKVRGLFDCSNNKVDWKDIIQLRGVANKINYQGNNLTGPIPTSLNKDKKEIGNQIDIDFSEKNEFSEGDLVVYKNPQSKFYGFKGVISSRLSGVAGSYSYKIRLDFKDNPGLEDKASQTSINKGFVIISDLKPDDIVKTDWKSEKVDTEPVEKSGIVKDPSNLFNKGDTAMYDGRPVRLLSLKTPLIWNIEVMYPSTFELKNDEVEFAVHCDLLKKYQSQTSKSQFRSGDPIIYLDPDGPLDNCKGKVTYSVGRIVDVDIIKQDGKHEKKMNVSIDKIELDTEKVKEIEKRNKEDRKFKKDDKIIYIADLDDSKNINYHLCGGFVSFFNDYSQSKGGTYDIRLTDRNRRTQYLYFIPSSNLKLQETKFAVDDKVIYNSDDQYDGQVAIVAKINGSTYELQWRDDENKLLFMDKIEAANLTKFVKPLGSKIEKTDDIVFTMPTSKHFGCVGVIKDYDTKTKEYKIEVKSREDKTVKISKVKPENLEVSPPKREFKKGDKIRYINSKSSNDGLIGIIDEIKPKDKCNITLKNSRGDTTSFISPIDNLVLLEESEPPKELKFGDWVKYVFPGSKYDGRIGTFEGTRLKDGVVQWTVKLDDDTSFVRLHVDAGTLYPTEERPPKTTTTTYSYTPPVKKKKKKDKPERRKPILVYNRRHVARKAYNPSGTTITEESSEESTEKGLSLHDKVRIKATGKEGVINGSYSSPGIKKFYVDVEGFKQGSYSENELEKIEDDDFEFKFEEGEKVIIKKDNIHGKIFAKWRNLKSFGGAKVYSINIGGNEYRRCVEDEIEKA